MMPLEPQFRYSPLDSWIMRKDSLRAFHSIRSRKPNQEFGGFLSLDYQIPLHEIGDIPTQYFKNSWESTAAYVRNSLKIIGRRTPCWLDGEEADEIVRHLGKPPQSCYPIYLVSISDADREEIVYIGRTSAATPRFASGHPVATKLHAPEFSPYDKYVYLACITLLTKEKEYLPLEWVHPLQTAQAILESIEAQLIYEFQSPLNSQHRKRYASKYAFTPLHIRNFTKNSKLLDDSFVFPRNLRQNEKPDKERIRARS